MTSHKIEVFFNVIRIKNHPAFFQIFDGFQRLTENRIDVIDDDLLQKLVEVRLAMDLLMEKKPEWFYRPHTRDGTG